MPTIFHFDGFEQWRNGSATILADLLAMYTTTSNWYINTGRDGGTCLQGEGVYLSKNVGNQPTLCVAAALKRGSTDYSTPAKLLAVRDGTTDQVYLTHDTATTISVKRGDGTVLAGSVTIPTLFNAWRHIQLLVTVHNTAGAVQVVVDGVTYVNLSGVDTQNTANAYASEALWNNNVGWGGFYFDDIYAADYLAGDLAVKYLPATSDSSIQFTRSTGSNSYANVDEAAGGHDSDSTYNYSSTVGHRDLYGVSYALAGSVKAVQMFAAARKDDAGTRGAKLIVKSGSAESLSSETSLSTSWMPIIGPVLQTDPNTSTAWTQSTVNAAKIGIEITS